MIRLFIILLVFFFPANTLLATQKKLVPDSPEIQASVEKAVQYLIKSGKGKDKETRPGGQALIALALLKAGVDPEHPMIREAVASIRSKIQTDRIAFVNPIYEIGISAMFLTELDSELYRPELYYLSWALKYTQQYEGGWGYLTQNEPDSKRGGDMSMTQYAVMGAWSMHRCGIEVSQPMMVAAGKWLLHVQAEDGAYAYTSRVDGSGRVTRESTRPSTTAAGMSGVYVLRDLFEMNSQRSLSNRKYEDDFAPPKAFRKVEPPPGDPSFTGGSMKQAQRVFSRSAFQQVQNRGNQWLELRFIESLDKKTQYFFYYLYAFERYCTFRELAENRTDPSPPWYNQIANYLISIQGSDGDWHGGLTKPIDTAYGILVMLRSTKKTLAQGPLRFDGGSMQGGRGLPKSTDQLEIRDGKVVSLTEIGSSEALLEQLDSIGDWDDRSSELLSNASPLELSELLTLDKDRIMQLLQATTPQARLTVVVTLKSSGDAKYASVLLYALSDPDPVVASAAQEALLAVFRDLKGKRLPPIEDKNYEKVRAEQIEAWKKRIISVEQ